MIIRITNMVKSVLTFCLYILFVICVYPMISLSLKINYLLYLLLHLRPVATFQLSTRQVRYLNEKNKTKNKLIELKSVIAMIP